MEPTISPGHSGKLSALEWAPIEKERIRFVLALGRALHRYGTPAHRLEEALAIVCRRLSLSAEILSTPTWIAVGFGDPAELRTATLRVTGDDLDLGKLAALDALADAVADRELPPADGLARIAEIESAPPTWNRWWTGPSHAVSAAAFAVFFGAPWRMLPIAALLGLVIGSLAALAARHENTTRAFPLAAAFIAAFAAVCAAAVLPGVTPSVLTITALVPILPGLTLTVAMTELATRNLVSGTARLMLAVIVLLELAIGVLVGERFAYRLVHVDQVAVHGLPAWTSWAATAVSSVALMILCQARGRALPWIAAACFVGYLGTRYGTMALGPELGVLGGSFALGVFVNLYARVLDRPQQVVQVPAVIMLVPGSMGLRGIRSLVAQDTLTGVETTFAALVVAMAIVAGLLMANAVVSPRRTL
ncbi:MAG TPA: threonine/serine exporter family protein [Kofleriaceae bacterium]|nr:threonine/serine exporter family protein [Kofleriaceae bacterium]